MSDGVDLRLLTAEERAKYDTFNRFQALPKRDQWLLTPKTMAVCAVLLTVSILFVAWGSVDMLSSRPATSGAGKPGDPAVTLLVAGIILAIAVFPVLFTVGRREVRTGLERMRHDYLLSIGYEDRVGGRAASRPVEPDQTTRQAQHEWYEGHDNLTWRDRVPAQSYGMDASTYISNVLENDKD